MISYWIYWSSFCFWWSIPFGIGYNCLYWLGYSLMQFPIHYLHIISGMFMPFGYPWCPRVIGWVSTQPGFVYPSDILQGSSCWGCLSLSLINHFLWLVLRIQLLYSLIGKLTYSVPACSDSSSLPLFLSSPNIGRCPQFCWACSEPSSSVLTSFWIHLSVSIVSSKAILFCSSSDSLLTFLGGCVSASLHMVPLHFPCSMCGSGLSFQQECFLTDLLSNCSIA